MAEQPEFEGGSAGGFDQSPGERERELAAPGLSNVDPWPARFEMDGLAALANEAERCLDFGQQNSLWTEPVCSQSRTGAAHDFTSILFGCIFVPAGGRHRRSRLHLMQQGEIAEYCLVHDVDKSYKSPCCNHKAAQSPSRTFTSPLSLHCAGQQCHIQRHSSSQIMAPMVQGDQWQ
jgi:hypothetical protein